MKDCKMDTQTQNTRNIDYDNYPVISRSDGLIEIIRPDGKRYDVFYGYKNDPVIARCDFRWYMERRMDSAFGCLRWA